MRNSNDVPLSLAKSISEIMAWFDFAKVAEIESAAFNRKAENEDNTLEGEIKDFALEGLWECAEEFSKRKSDGWIEGKYGLRFEYFHDEKEPSMCLKYIPIQWD